MNYQLEIISDEDWQRVLADIKADPRKAPRLERRPHLGWRKDVWAIDRENDSYLFRSSSVVVEPGSSGFSFFYNNHFYWGHLTLYGYPRDQGLGAIVNFYIPTEGDPQFITDEALAPARVALKQAFTVYKEFGSLDDKIPFNVLFGDEVKHYG